MYTTNYSLKDLLPVSGSRRADRARVSLTSRKQRHGRHSRLSQTDNAITSKTNNNLIIFDRQ